MNNQNWFIYIYIYIYIYFQDMSYCDLRQLYCVEYYLKC